MCLYGKQNSFITLQWCSIAVHSAVLPTKLLNLILYNASVSINVNCFNIFNTCTPLRKAMRWQFHFVVYMMARRKALCKLKYLTCVNIFYSKGNSFIILFQLPWGEGKPEV